MNGIDAHGGLIPYAGTFLNFAGYAMGALRLSAMSRHGIIFVATHDSIGLGEDGPTHQPVEIMAALRATPNTLVLRPADQTETSAAWTIALEHRDTPSILCLSRQNLPSLDGTSLGGVRLGAYTIAEYPAATKNPAVVLIGSGSEVQLAVEAAKDLVKNQGVESVRVVSMPSWELFEDQSPSYRRSILPGGAAIVSIEPFASLGWEKYSHFHVGLKEWGASAPADVLYKELGITSEAMVKAAKGLLERYGSGKCPAVMPLVAKI
jgi:transketolase